MPLTLRVAFSTGLRLSWDLRAGAHLSLDLLVIGNAAVDHSLLAGVDDDEGQVDDGVGRRRPAGLLLRLAVPLHQILEGNLL